MEQRIKLTCPSCGISVIRKSVAGLEKYTLECYKCKQKNIFSAWSPQPVTTAPKQNTVAPVGNDDATQLGSINFTIGRLRQKENGIAYQLKEGHNIVGRKSSGGKANFQIDTGSKRAMSREHLNVEVVKESFKGFVHYLSLCKENVNPTALNGQTLQYGIDRLILNEGDIIRLPDAELIFEIPDDEETRLM